MTFGWPLDVWSLDDLWVTLRWPWYDLRMTLAVSQFLWLHVPWTIICLATALLCINFRIPWKWDFQIYIFSPPARRASGDSKWHCLSVCLWTAISLKLSNTDPKCYIFSESLGPGLHSEVKKFFDLGPPKNQKGPPSEGLWGVQMVFWMLGVEVWTQEFQKYITLWVCVG